MIKKILAIGLLGLLMIPLAVLAEDCLPGAPAGWPCPDPANTPTQVCAGPGCVGANIIEIKPPGGLAIYGLAATVSRITKYLLYAALAIAPLMVLYGAITLLFAQGEPKKVETGRNVIIWALVGLAIFLAAKILTNVVISAFTP